MLSICLFALPEPVDIPGAYLLWPISSTQSDRLTLARKEWYNCPMREWEGIHMIKIAVCDDEAGQARLLEGHVQAWGRERREPCSVRLFPSGDAFLFQWEEEKDWNALLLDIQMPGLNGLDLARQLRKSGSTLPIVFITGLPDYMDQGFELEALHYLIKPISREKLFACLDRAMKRDRQEPALLLSTLDSQELRVPQKDITVVEASGRRALVTAAGSQTIEVKASFQSILSQLVPDDFVQCHRSYVVGLRHIRLLGKEQLTLDSGQAVPVSRRLFPQVNAAFINFYKT